jgi:actin-related protein 2
MVADEAAPYKAMLELNYPVEEGIVKNWDDMGLIWGRAFELLKTDIPNTKILMTEAVMNPFINRVKMSEIVFE